MLTVCIQAGGESSRMGEDKALKPFLGRPLIQRILERLSPIADELIVTTNRPDAYRFLGARLTPDLMRRFEFIQNANYSLYWRAQWPALQGP